MNGDPVSLIIDGFETKISKSTNKVIESECFSEKKKMNLLKTLIAISSQTKKIKWISYPEGGSHNDHMLCENQLHKLMKHMKPWGKVIEDEGFKRNSSYYHH